MSEDEAELWRQLARSIDTVKAKPRVATHGGEAAVPPASKPSRAQRAHHGPAAPVPSAPGAAPPPTEPPPPAEFDRRALRQVAAGKIPIDGVLDLHGLHQDAAHARLRAFLVSSQAKGHRMVLVITGKGGGARSTAPHLRSYGVRGGEKAVSVPRGVLRRSVPQWLEGPEFRAIVVGYAAAGVRHGGDGALYVRLRKARNA